MIDAQSELGGTGYQPVRAGNPARESALTLLLRRSAAKKGQPFNALTSSDIPPNAFVAQLKIQNSKFKIARKIGKVMQGNASDFDTPRPPRAKVILRFQPSLQVTVRQQLAESQKSKLNFLCW